MPEAPTPVSRIYTDLIPGASPIRDGYRVIYAPPFDGRASEPVVLAYFLILGTSFTPSAPAVRGFLDWHHAKGAADRYAAQFAAVAVV